MTKYNAPATWRFSIDVAWAWERAFQEAPTSLTRKIAMRSAMTLSPDPTLRKAYGVPFGLPATRWMLEIGAVLLRTETELILKSRRVVPGRLLEAGFEFKYSEWREAAPDLCRHWKAARTGHAA